MMSTLVEDLDQLAAMVEAVLSSNLQNELRKKFIKD